MQGRLLDFWDYSDCSPSKTAPEGVFSSRRSFYTSRRRKNDLRAVSELLGGVSELLGGDEKSFDLLREEGPVFPKTLGKKKKKA